MRQQSASFVNRFGREIDWTRLWKVLEQLSLDCLAWNMLDLGVQYLGLDPQAVSQPPHIPEAGQWGSALLDMLDAARSLGAMHHGAETCANR
ncbi:MAG: hypothetical protein ACLU9S_24770 [Oscillospiraceae bacterium]